MPMMRANSARSRQFAHHVDENLIGIDRHMRRYFPIFYGRQAEWHAADILIAGGNPILAMMIIATALRMGHSVLWWHDHHVDDWPYFLCQDLAFRRIIEQASGWSGPDADVWRGLDDISGRFIGRPDAEACRMAALWCRAFGAWGLYPGLLPERRAGVGLLMGTGLLSLANVPNSGTEAMVYARMAGHMKAAHLDIHDQPVDDITRLCTDYAHHHVWCRGGRWAKLVFARHIFVLSRFSAPTRLVAGQPVPSDMVSGAMLGSARPEWNSAAPAERVQFALEDIMFIRAFFADAAIKSIS